MRQFLAGEKPEDIASDYDLTEDEVLAVIRVLSGYSPGHKLLEGVR